jgi:hypothetical protein
LENNSVLSLHYLLHPNKVVNVSVFLETKVFSQYFNANGPELSSSRNKPVFEIYVIAACGGSRPVS